MPELPEVETIAAGLRRRAAGRVIGDVSLFLPKLVRGGEVSALAGLRGRSVLSVGRRGKILVISCEGERCLLFHLKMTGQFQWADPALPRDKHTHLIVKFRDEGPELRFRDVRKFGFARVVESADPAGCPEVAALGPEPLDTDFAEFAARLTGRRGRLKSLLLNQQFLAGIGNIYADEILYASRLHPLVRAGSLTPGQVRRLWSAVRRILRRAIAAGGSSIRDYKDDEGSLGHFQFAHRAYGREGRPCRRCGSPIRRIVVGGRASFFCPRCTPFPRRRQIPLVCRKGAGG